MAEQARDPLAQIGGRLKGEKSATYRRGLGQVEGRANPYLARHMLASDLAYVLSSAELGVTPAEDARTLVGTILEFLDEIERDGAPAGSADIVVERQRWFTERLGAETAAWLHVGRSRGESTRSYLPRMFFRHHLWEERVAVARLVDALLSQARPALDKPLPAYTHLQHGGITTLGEYLLWWVAALRRHAQRLEQATDRLDVAPTVGTSRRKAIELAEQVRGRLGFSVLAGVRRDSNWCEDQFSEPLSVLALLGVELARIAEDLRLWMSSEFRLFDMADAHASTSSALPQKKNPFALQAIVGGASIGVGRLAAQLGANISIADQSDALYHAGSLFEHATDMVAWTELLADIVAEGTYDYEEMRKQAVAGYTGTVDARDLLVFEHGVSFGVAHQVLGALVRAASDGEELPNASELVSTAVGRPVDIDQSEIAALIMGPEVPETSFDVPRVQAYWEESAAWLEAERNALGDRSPTDAAIAALRAEASDWLSPPPSGRGGRAASRPRG